MEDNKGYRAEVSVPRKELTVKVSFRLPTRAEEVLAFASAPEFMPRSGESLCSVMSEMLWPSLHGRRQRCSLGKLQVQASGGEVTLYLSQTWEECWTFSAVLCAGAWTRPFPAFSRQMEQ